MKTKMNYILTDEKIFVGLEDSKRTWKICVRSGGHIVSEKSMPSSCNNLLRFLEHYFPNCSTTLIYEAGFHGFTLHDQLLDEDIKSVVIPPHLVTEEKSNKVKTDKRDAKRLAKILETHDYKNGCHVPDKELREDRQISRTVFQVQRKITSTKNQIRRFLEFHGLDENFPAGPWRDTNYKHLSNLITAGELKMSHSLQLSIEVLLSTLSFLQNHKKSLKKELTSLANKERYKSDVEILMSVPGIGEFTAIRLLLEWGDITRFSSGKKFSSFTGMTPTEYSTGGTQKKGHITGQGSKLARSALVEAAWVAIRFDPVLNKKYLDIKRRTRESNIAIVAVARKIAVRIRAILLRHEKYEISLIK
jgi:transposase